MHRIEAEYNENNAGDIEPNKLKATVSNKLSKNNKPEKEFKVCAKSVFRLRNID